jgi:hypothetical protein
MMERSRGVESARAALSRLPTWVPVLGVALVLGELIAAAGVRTPRPAGTETVVLRVDGVTGGPSLSYETPTESATDNSRNMPFVKEVRVEAGGSVTIHTFSGTADPVTCSITVNGKVLSRVTSHGFWDKTTCHSKIP